MFYRHRRISFSLLLGFLTLSLFAGMGPVRVEALSLVPVYGWVVDGNGDPIPDAQIIFWNIEKVFATKTDTLGRYEMDVTAWKSYQAYAYCDYPSTLGFDYVPAHRQVSVGETAVNVSFTLFPGASVNVRGYLLSFENLKPPTTINFTVIDQYGLLNETDSVRRYGKGLLSSYILKLGDRTLVVPSGIPVKVLVDIHYPGALERRLALDRDGDYLNLTQGYLLNIDIRGHAMGADIDLGYGYVASARAAISEAEREGFYVAYERNQLSMAENLVDAAASALAKGSYDETLADLRQAYLTVRSVESAISSLYMNASKAVGFITPLLAFTAVAVASILYDGWHRRVTLSLALYSVLLGTLYLLFPGYTTLQKSPYNPWAGTPFTVLLTPLVAIFSFLAAFLVIFGLPYAFREKTSMQGLRPVSAIAAAFAIAARNLRRRRLRTLLAVTFMTTSVFAFISLTSLSFEYGFSVKTLLGQAPSEGFLLRKPSTSVVMPFMAIEPEIIQWLEERPDTSLIVPKIESLPQADPLGTLTSASGGFDVWGVLGVFPSLEAKVTRMNDIVNLGQFLSDEDLDGILISQEAAERLQAGVNDTLTFIGRNFTVNGIFDSRKLEDLRDLDGEPLVPYMVTMTPFPVLMRCLGKDVVIMHGEAAQRLGMAVSRVVVQTKNHEEIMSLARLTVLRWLNVEAFASSAGTIQHLSIGSYYVASGFLSAMVPLVLVALNIGALMLNTVYERKRETATMSALGMNPFHITLVFVAEALVIGIVAGSLGYILGLTSYRFMTVFMPFGVKQKVEAYWIFLALCVSVATAVLGSVLPATKASIITTPSLLRRWKIEIEEKPRATGEPWLLKIPIRIREEDRDRFFRFLEEWLQKSFHPHRQVENLKVSREAADPSATRLSFAYVSSEEGFATENDLFLVKSHVPGQYAIRLASRTRRGSIATPDEVDVWRTVDFVRQLILQYSTEQGALRG